MMLTPGVSPAAASPEELLVSSPVLKQLTLSVDTFLTKHELGKHEDPWMGVCQESYTTFFESIAKQAHTEKETGKDLFSAQCPNLGDTLATYKHRSDAEKAGPMLVEQLRGTFLNAEDLAMVEKQAGRKEDVGALLGELGTVPDDGGDAGSRAVQEHVVGSLNAAQRAMGLGRLILEVFERKGLENLNTLVKKMELVALIILEQLGRTLGPPAIEARPAPWKRHVFHGLMRIAADAYSHLALALRYEAHYELTKPKGHYSAAKSLALLRDGHKLNKISMHYRTLARAPVRMASSMNGMVQNVEFLYTLNRLVASDAAIEFAPAFTEAEVLERRLQLWRVVGAVRWKGRDAWGVTDTTRRILNILLQKALLEQAPDETLRQIWVEGMRVRQLLLGLLLRPKADIGYNRYPGFLPPVTLAEIAHDIAEAEAMVTRKRPELNLALCACQSWGKCDTKLLVDLLRQRFSVHGEVGNFLQAHTEELVASEITSLSGAEERGAYAERLAGFRAELLAEPLDDEPISEVLPTSYKTFPVLSSVVLPPAETEGNASVYMAVLRRFAHALRRVTQRPHALWSPGEALEAAFDLGEAGCAPAREVATLAGYWAADGSVDYATCGIAQEFLAAPAEPGALQKFLQVVDDALSRVDGAGIPTPKAEKLLRNIHYGQRGSNSLPVYTKIVETNDDGVAVGNDAENELKGLLTFGDCLKLVEERQPTKSSPTWFKVKSLATGLEGWVVGKLANKIFNCVDMGQYFLHSGPIPNAAYCGQDFPHSGMYTEGYAGQHNVCLVSASGDNFWREVNIELLFRNIGTATVFEQAWEGNAEFTDWVAFYACNCAMYGELGTETPKRFIVTVKPTADHTAYPKEGIHPSEVKADIGNAQFKECEWLRKNLPKKGYPWEKVVFTTTFKFLKDYCRWSQDDCKTAAKEKAGRVLDKEAFRCLNLQQMDYQLDMVKGSLREAFDQECIPDEVRNILKESETLKGNANLLMKTLREAASKGNEGVKEAAMLFVEQRLLGPLKSGLKDENPRVRRAAAESLAHLGDQAALPELEKALKEETHAGVLWAVEEAVEKLKPKLRSL